MNASTTDEELLELFVNGAPDALGELAQRFERPLLGFACGMLGGRRDAAMDAVQETWLRVVRYGRSFNNRSSVKTWLYRIVLNQCRNVQSRKRHDAKPLEGESLSASDSPDAAIVFDEERRALQEAVMELHADKRSIILLCYHTGMTHEQ